MEEPLPTRRRKRIIADQSRVVLNWHGGRTYRLDYEVAEEAFQRFCDEYVPAEVLLPEQSNRYDHQLENGETMLYWAVFLEALRTAVDPAGRRRPGSYTKTQYEAMRGRMEARRWLANADLDVVVNLRMVCEVLGVRVEQAQALARSVLAAGLDVITIPRHQVTPPNGLK